MRKVVGWVEFLTGGDAAPDPVSRNSEGARALGTTEQLQCGDEVVVLGGRGELLIVYGVTGETIECVSAYAAEQSSYRRRHLWRIRDLRAGMTPAMYDNHSRVVKLLAKAGLADERRAEAERIKEQIEQRARANIAGHAGQRPASPGDQG